jgi:3-methyladenine DNA glycosylase Tag
MLRDFEDIYALAAARKGGVAALEEILAETPTVDASVVARLTDDRVLSRMTHRIFAAGFSYLTIDRKWPAFETAFRGFDPRACAAMSEAHFDALMADRNFTRNGPKVQAVMRNARFLLDLAAEHGSAAKFFAAWPDSDFISLVAIVRKRGSYMGGETAMRFIRALGKPAFVTSPDMIAALIREGVLTGPSGSRRALAMVQAALNEWVASWGRDLTVISRVLSMSVGAMPPAPLKRRSSSAKPQLFR